MTSAAPVAVPPTFRPEVRIAISLRLSRSDDASTSLDVQLRACHDSIRAAGFDPETAEVFIDDGVSGATPLADREGMSGLMEYQPTHVWAWKLDRYSRSVREFLQLVEWAEGTPSKRVVLATADGSLNTGTPGGRLIALILVALAEWEREMMKERILSAHKERREQGRWISGFAPFPFKTVREHPKAPAYLDADSAMIPLVIKGIGVLLSESGNLSNSCEGLPIGRQQWRKLLMGVTLRGWRKHKGELVVQDDGVTPVQFAPEVLDAVTYARVQAKLKQLARPESNVPRSDAPFLAGFLVCAKCDGGFNGGKSSRNKPLYKCGNGCGSIMADVVEPLVFADYRERFGLDPVMRKVHSGGVDHSAALADLEASRQRIVKAIALVDGPALEDLAAKLTDTKATIERLAAEHSPEVTTTFEPTKTLMFELWDGADQDTRRTLLTEQGLRVMISPARKGLPSVERAKIEWGAPPRERKRLTRPKTVAERRMIAAAPKESAAA
ncbi:recombinase family protein [Streptomyces huasconensis]|nr:recombinase family protein [Streptomyces sp. JCM 35825]UFQ15523.1 recombinase family protein [Streptomyces huasconensis]WCL85126.1 recombinase family protein [Streptomyces sp. JCM 35825]